MPNIDLLVVASQLTSSVFKQQKIQCVTHDAPRTKKVDLKSTDRNILSARILISEFQPDAILVGLSGDGCGIDEALVACADDTKTYALQDFWGDVNIGFGKLPGTFFVLDEYAREQTIKKIPDANVVVSGSTRSPKCDHFFSRKKYTDTLDWCGEAAEQNLAVFYGQNLWHLPGYRQTIAAVSEGLRKYNRPHNLYYRPHPTENLHFSQTNVRDLNFDGVDIAIEEPKPLYVSLASAGISFTCFSSCSRDLALLSAYSSEPLGCIVHTLFSADVFDHYYKATGLGEIPMVKQGMASLVKNEGELLAKISDALTTKTKVLRWRKSKSKLGESELAIRVISQAIIADYKTGLKAKS